MCAAKCLNVDVEGHVIVLTTYNMEVPILTRIVLEAHIDFRFDLLFRDSY